MMCNCHIYKVLLELWTHSSIYIVLIITNTKQSWAIMTETRWSSKPVIYTIWSFTKKKSLLIPGIEDRLKKGDQEYVFCTWIHQLKNDMGWTRVMVIEVDRAGQFYDTGYPIANVCGWPKVTPGIISEFCYE